MGIIDRFRRKKKKTVHVQLDPDTVKRDHLVKALANENAELKAEMALLKKQIGTQRESEKDKEEEDEVKLFLDAEKKEIKSKSYGKFFSLGNLYKKMFYEKGFAKKIYITTWNRGEKIARFVDFGFSTAGDFIVLGKRKNSKVDKPEVILKTMNLKDMFQSVSALGNDIDSKMIPVNLDEDGAWIENVMEWDAP
ncbi:MAG: hypothetical protein AABY22_33355 [Nanoarchaeota archaeon]